MGSQNASENQSRVCWHLAHYDINIMHLHPKHMEEVHFQWGCKEKGVFFIRKGMDRQSSRAREEGLR